MTKRLCRSSQVFLKSLYLSDDHPFLKQDLYYSSFSDVLVYRVLKNKQRRFPSTPQTRAVHRCEWSGAVFFCHAMKRIFGPALEMLVKVKSQALVKHPKCNCWQNHLDRLKLQTEAVV